MYQLQRIKSLYKYTDGDVIDAGMGVQIDPGYGLVQYWDEQQGKVVNTDFSQHPAILYPFPYSSKRGQYVVPSTQGQQWYYNNPDTDTAGILDETGAVKDAYKALFEVTSVVIGTLTFPALRIKGNLATANDLTDKRIYYKSSYNGKNFTCCQLIPVQTTVGDATDILISVTSADGSGTNVLTTATLSSDKKTITIAPVSKTWTKGSTYTVYGTAYSQDGGVFYASNTGTNRLTFEPGTGSTAKAPENLSGLKAVASEDFAGRFVVSWTAPKGSDVVAYNFYYKTNKMNDYEFYTQFDLFDIDENSIMLRENSFSGTGVTKVSFIVLPENASGLEADVSKAKAVEYYEKSLSLQKKVHIKSHI